MTAFTTYTDGSAPGPAIPLRAGGLTPQEHWVVVEFDAAKRNLTSSDTMRLFTIPAKTLIKDVFAEVITSEGADVGFEIGDGSDPNGFCENADADAGDFTVGAGAYLETSTARVYGKLYADATDLLITAASGDTLDTLKVRVTVRMFSV